MGRVESRGMSPSIPHCIRALDLLSAMEAALGIRTDIQICPCRNRKTLSSLVSFRASHFSIIIIIILIASPSPPNPAIQRLNPRPKPPHNLADPRNLLKLQLQLVNLRQQRPEPRNLTVRGRKPVGRAGKLPLGRQVGRAVQSFEAGLDGAHDAFEVPA